jgi:hypothetical protein
LETTTVRSILAFVMAAIFVAVMAILVLREIPDANRDFFNITLGALIGSFTGIVQWYFGSSSGSDEKTKLLADSEPKTGP